MNRIVMGILLTMLLLAAPRPSTLPTAFPAAPTEEVAFITQMEGDVRLARDGKMARITSSTLLRVGDVISTLKDGGALIYQVNAPIFRLRPNERKKIDKIPPPPPKGGLTPEEFAWFKKHYAQAATNRRRPSPKTMGDPNATRLTLLSPRYSLALDARPEFVWTKLARASDYVVKVFDRRGEVLWNHTTDATRIAYGGERSLSDGDYRWEVTARVERRATADQSLYDAAPFTVAVERSPTIRRALEQARQVGAETATGNVIYIGALLENGLYPQAEIELRQALTSYPHDQSLWALLMESYRLMQRWPDREKARASSTSPNPADGLQQLPDLPR